MFLPLCYLRIQRLKQTENYRLACCFAREWYPSLMLWGKHCLWVFEIVYFVHLTHLIFLIKQTNTHTTQPYSSLILQRVPLLQHHPQKLTHPVTAVPCTVVMKVPSPLMYTVQDHSYRTGRCWVKRTIEDCASSWIYHDKIGQYIVTKPFIRLLYTGLENDSVGCTSRLM